MDPVQEKLVRDHVGYVRALAAQIARTLPAQVDMDELVAYGMRGLAEAAARYDPDKGALFKTYAYYRIRGAMFDGLRLTGWLARDDHARVKALERADDILEEAASVPGTQAPSAVEAARKLSDLLSDVSAVYVTSVDSFSRMAADPESPGGAVAIVQGLCSAETSATVRRAMDALPEKERELLQKHYYEDHTLEDAGKAIGISKSWASRVHAKAIRRLRELLEQQGPDATEGAAAR